MYFMSISAQVCLILCFLSRDASEDCEECGDYVRLVFSVVPVSLATINVLIVSLFQFSQGACSKNGEFQFCC